MSNYAQLADRAKVKQVADLAAVERHKELSAPACVFFAGVRNHLIEEMSKANVELSKRKAPLLDRNFMPGFSDELFLTYGTDSLCRIGIGIMSRGCRITAVLSGPPNGYEISRKEYLCAQDPNCREVFLPDGEGTDLIPQLPQRIAADIISGILIGRFD